MVPGDPEPIRVRRAALADVAILAEFNARMARETEGLELDRARLTAGVRALFDAPERGFYLLAEERSTPVGQLMVTPEWSDWRNAFFWWLQSVYVEPGWRRRGVFAALLDRLRAMARDADQVCGLRLYVHHANQAAQQAYARSGLRPAEYRMMEEFLD